MTDTKIIDEELAKIQVKVKEQGDVVRELKANNATKAEVKEAVSLLKALKKSLDMKELELTPAASSQFDRTKFEELMKHRFFYDQSFSIYGGVQGLYDYGPMGCAIEANLLSAWRQFFVLEEQILEIKATMLTPEPVLRTSGHVERFTDFMVRDVKTTECFRADHLVEAHLEDLLKNKKTPAELKEEIERKLLPQIDNYGKTELQALIERFKMKSMNGNDLSEPQEFNLMFSTSIGPQGNIRGYLRPETAQGMFVNFQRLLAFNQGKLPFAASQIGSSFRNEISPRSGLIRVREFTMAEIEHFIDPTDKNHPKFHRVADLNINLLSACDQMDGKRASIVRLGDAVANKTIANETLGYFMGRIYMFLMAIGVKPDCFRFRQHLSNEMAHYACDCWDAECRTSYGWIECVGCADRSAYDLEQHTKVTGVPLVASRTLKEPRIEQVTAAVPNKKLLGKALRGGANGVIKRLEGMAAAEVDALEKTLQESGKAEIVVDGKSFDISADMLTINRCEKKVFVDEFTPNVIEPSFGIGRIMYCVFEQNFAIREGDEARTYLTLPSLVAPFKCSVLPLSNDPKMLKLVQKLSDDLTSAGVSHRTDTSSISIGRRYARTDQIAIPFGVTVDFDSLNKEPCTVTLRERDTMRQIRVPLDDLPGLVGGLSVGRVTWADAQGKYPAFEQQETAK